MQRHNRQEGPSPARGTTTRTGLGRSVRLAATNVTKRFRSHSVLRNASLTVHEGQAAAIIGANGCGKSTFLKICAGLISPTTGMVHVNGVLGYCPQDVSLFGFLRAEEHFALFGAGHGMSRKDSRKRGTQFARALGWEARAKTQARRLSGGTQQKLNVGLAALGDPDILLLDEPYQGFDRGTYVDFWEHVFYWRDAGKAVVIVTHMLNSLDNVDIVLDLTPQRNVAEVPA